MPGNGRREQITLTNHHKIHRAEQTGREYRLATRSVVTLAPTPTWFPPWPEGLQARLLDDVVANVVYLESGVFYTVLAGEELFEVAASSVAVLIAPY